MKARTHITINAGMIAIATLLTLSSCEYKDLYEDGYNNVASLKIDFDFSGVDSIPTQFRVALYPADETTQENMTQGYTLYDVPNHKTTLQKVPVGLFHITAWNNDIEHAIPNGYGSQNTLNVYTPPYATTERHGIPDVIDSLYWGQVLYDYPDYMVHANRKNVMVIKDEEQTVTLKVDSMVVAIDFRIRKIAGLEAVELVKGALNNVAWRRYMAFDNLTEDTITVMFDCSCSPADSTVYGRIHVFGIEPSELEKLNHKMTLFFWLANGKVFVPLDVTKAFALTRKNQKRMTIEIDNLDINLKDLIGTRNTFEVKVNQWEDVFIDISM